MSQDERWLQKRGRTWYAVMEVPAKLRQTIGKRRLIRSLETEDHRLALVKRHAVLAEFHAEIDAARKPRDTMQSALAWRDTIERLRKGDHSTFSTSLAPEPDVDPTEHALAIAHALIDEQASGIADGSMLLKGDGTLLPGPKPDPALAKRFASVAHGRETPLEPFLERWLTEADIEERSKGDHTRAVKELLAWARTANLMATVEGFDRRAAGRYVSHLLGTGLDRQKTVSKRLWSLSSLWRWLIAKGYTESNPWKGHAIGNGRSARDKQPERAFTEGELRKLLGGPAEPVLHDLMRLALLSGARIEELALLRVKDIDRSECTMSIQADVKTAASRRIVPVHSTIWPMVEARVTPDKPDAFLFPELGPEPKPGRQRSMPISKRFGRYRLEVGVEDKKAGQRRSLVNFHSFRRTFITLAEQAGIPESTIKSVVGHKRQGMTFGVYSGGPSLEQRRACVEAVKLPRNE